MKKIFLFLLYLEFLVCAFFLGTGRVLAWDFTGEWSGGSNQAMIFADPNFSQATHSFKPGQTVYLKITSQTSGDREKTLRLLDSSKSQVLKMSLNQAGSNPYTFTGSFVLPSQEGVYYADVRIDNGQGAVFASQENINVGQTSGSVSSEVVVQVEQGGQVVTGGEISQEIEGSPTLATDSFSPEVLSEKDITEEEKKLEVFSWFDFFKRIFSSFLQIFNPFRRLAD